MAKGEHAIRNRVIGSVLSAAIIGIAPTLFPGGWPAVIKGIGSFFTLVWTWLLKPASLPIWLLIVLGILALCFVGAVAALVFALLRPSKPEDQHAGYTEDVIEGIRWRWSWGAYGPVGLASFCPDCDYQIIVRKFQFTDRPIFFRCEECNRDLKSFEGTVEEFDSKIKRKIDQKARSMTKPAPKK